MLLLVAGPRPLAGAARGAPAEGLASLRRTFLEPPEAAKPLTRWWWFGGAVTPEEISRELRFMKDAGLGGAEIQPVYPVAVDDPARGIRHIPYYTAEWWSVLRHAVAEARRLGLRLDLTLGSGWPYGGPFVPGGLAARRLRVLSQDVAGPEALVWDVTPHLAGDGRPVAVVAAPVGRDARPDLSRARVLSGQPEPEPVETPRGGRRIRFEAPAGVWRVMLFLDTPTGQLVKRPTLGMEGFVIDHHSREATELFLRAAGDRVLDALRGAPQPPFDSVFCDSLEVYGADWTPDLLREFESRRGYDLAPYLPALVQPAGPETPHVRYDYHRTLSELNLEYFFEPLVRWAGEHGMRARIQAHGAPGDVMRAYGAADVPEGENIFLGDRNEVNLRHRRLASSAAHLYDRPVASSETYTWLRTPLYMTTLEMMKAATDAVLLDGLNQIVNHGYSYSPPEAGEPGWAFYASTAANHTNTWWRHYPHLARYVQRACALLRRGASVNPVAVYLPLADLFARYGVGGIHVDVEAEAAIDPALFTGLRRSGYDFDLIQDHALTERAAVEEGRLSAGTGRYPVVIVPGARLMPAASVRRLAELAEAGGRVLFVGREPEGAPGRVEAGAADFAPALGRLRAAGSALVADADAALARLRQVLAPDVRIVEARDRGRDRLASAAESVGFVHRRDGDVDLYFVSNVSEHRFETRIRFAVGHRAPERWDPGTGRADGSPVYAFVPGDAPDLGGTEVELHLEPFGSRFVVFGGSAREPFVTRRDFGGPLAVEPAAGGAVVTAVVGESGERALQLGDGSWRRFRARVPDPVTVGGPWRLRLGEGPAVELPALRSWNELPEGGSFSGWGLYETTFEAPPLAEDLEWRIDLGAVHETAEVRLNGEPLGAAWKAPRRLACGSALRPGRNHLAVEVANLWIHAVVAREPPAEWKQLEETWGIRWGRYGEVPPETLPPSGLLGPVRLLPRRRIRLTL